MTTNDQARQAAERVNAAGVIDRPVIHQIGEVQQFECFVSGHRLIVADVARHPELKRARKGDQLEITSAEFHDGDPATWGPTLYADDNAAVQLTRSTIDF